MLLFHKVADLDPHGTALFLKAESGSALECKAGSDSALKSNSEASEAENRALEGHGLAMEAWRLKMKP